MRDGLGQQRLAGPGRPVEQDALGDARAEGCEPVGLAQELDDLAQLVLRLVRAGHVDPADARVAVRLDGLGLRARHHRRPRATSGTAARAAGRSAATREGSRGTPRSRCRASNAKGTPSVSAGHGPICTRRGAYPPIGIGSARGRLRLTIPDPGRSDGGVLLRPPTLADVPAIVEACSSDELARWLPRLPTRTRSPTPSGGSPRASDAWRDGGAAVRRRGAGDAAHGRRDRRLAGARRWAPSWLVARAARAGRGLMTRAVAAGDALGAPRRGAAAAAGPDPALQRPLHRRRRARRLPTRGPPAPGARRPRHGAGRLSTGCCRRTSCRSVSARGLRCSSSRRSSMRRSALSAARALGCA